MENVNDDPFSYHPLPSISALTGEEVADGFQRADFVSPGLINLHLEKAYLLVEYRAENTSFHTLQETLMHPEVR